VDSSFGVGGRFGFRLSRRVDLEANLSYLQEPTQPTRLPGGLQGLFGIKSGWQGKDIALYAKARFGFLRYQDKNHSSQSCPDLLSTAPCYDTPPQIDIGGVIEFFRTLKVVPRVEVGDVMTLYRGRHSSSSETRHSLQIQVGAGLRF